MQQKYDISITKYNINMRKNQSMRKNMENMIKKYDKNITKNSNFFTLKKKKK